MTATVESAARVSENGIEAVLAVWKFSDGSRGRGILATDKPYRDPVHGPVSLSREALDDYAREIVGKEITVGLLTPGPVVPGPVVPSVDLSLDEQKFKALAAILQSARDPLGRFYFVDVLARPIVVGNVRFFEWPAIYSEPLR